MRSAKRARPRRSERGVHFAKLMLVGPSMARAEVRALRARLGGADFVVAVDGGLDHCLKAGWFPDVAVGDWDSLKNRSALRHLRQALGVGAVVTLSRDKDRSDLHHALRAAAKLLGRGPASTIDLMGFGGGRPDHLLAGLIEVGDFAARAPRNVSSITWDDGDARYHFLSARLPRSELALRKGQTVSVFAWHSTVRGLTLTGFAYPLRRATLTPSSGGLSNRATKTRCVISLESGRLLVVLPRRLNYS